MTGTARHSKSSSSIHVAIVDSAEQLARLAPEWDDLWERAQPENAFVSYAWMSTWWRHFGASKKLLIITVRDPENRLVGLGPFYCGSVGQSPLRIRRVGFLADQLVGSDYLDVLLDPAMESQVGPAIARELLNHSNEWDYIELEDGPETPRFSSFYETLQQRSNSFAEVESSVCRFISLPKDFKEYLTASSALFRKRYNQRWRAIRNEAEIDLQRLHSESEFCAHFQNFLQLHRMRYDESNQQSALAEPGVEAFQQDAAQAMARSGKARLFFLRANGQPIAVLYGFAAGRTFQYYQSGMDPGWMRFSAGKVVMGAAVEQIVSEGFTTFDFLRGGESYKSEWARESRRTISRRYFDTRPTSQMMALWLATRSKVGKLRRDWKRKQSEAVRNARRKQTHTTQAD